MLCNAGTSPGTVWRAQAGASRGTYTDHSICRSDPTLRTVPGARWTEVPPPPRNTKERYVVYISARCAGLRGRATVIPAGNLLCAQAGPANVRPANVKKMLTHTLSVTCSPDHPRTPPPMPRSAQTRAHR